MLAEWESMMIGGRDVIGTGRIGGGVSGMGKEGDDGEGVSGMGKEGDDREGVSKIGREGDYEGGDVIEWEGRMMMGKG